MRLRKSSNPTPFGWNGIYLQFGSAISGVVGLKGFDRGDGLTCAHFMDLTGPRPDCKQAATIDFNADDQLVVVAADQAEPFQATRHIFPEERLLGLHTNDGQAKRVSHFEKEARSPSPCGKP
jgi:hypothetical protein